MWGANKILCCAGNRKMLSFLHPHIYIYLLRERPRMSVTEKKRWIDVLQTKAMVWYPCKCCISQLVYLV